MAEIELHADGWLSTIYLLNLREKFELLDPVRKRCQHSNGSPLQSESKTRGVSLSPREQLRLGLCQTRCL